MNSSLEAVVVAQVVAHRNERTRVQFPLLLEAGLFSLSLIFPLSISGTPLIRSLVEVPHYWSSTFQENELKKA